uniref:Inter-alpha-trypsin inhibitor heavy chain C-terminal domain-containing protein n=1 Tax=Loxodonta africana TaxID=9785 RepID=G3TN55_LOXAF
HMGEADLPPPTRIQRGETCARITFYSSLQDRSAFSSSGIMADFMVQYDVVMEDIIGDVQFFKNYFCFNPRHYSPKKADVCFVLICPSSLGIHIPQTKKAMNVILSDLWANNYFNIIYFSDTVTVWKAGGSIQAIIQNVHSAKDDLRCMEADGFKHPNGKVVMMLEMPKMLPSFPHSSHNAGNTTITFYTGTRVSEKVLLLNHRNLLQENLSRLPLWNPKNSHHNLLRGLPSLFPPHGTKNILFFLRYPKTSILLTELVCSHPLIRDMFKHVLFVINLCICETLIAILFDLPSYVVATNSSQKTFGCPGEPGPNGAHFIHRLWAYITIGQLLEACFKPLDSTTHHVLAAKAINLSLEYKFVTPLACMVMVQPKQTSKEARSQASTTGGPVPSCPHTPAAMAGAGTSHPALVSKVSSKSKSMRLQSYLSSTTLASTKMPNSKELEPLGHSPRTLSTPKAPNSSITGFWYLGTANSQDETCSLVSSDSSALLPLKLSTSSHQNPGILLSMNPKPQVPFLNPGTPSQPKPGIMKHVTPLYSKPGAPSQPKLHVSLHPQPTLHSLKNLPQLRSGVSTLQIPKHLSHTRPRISASKTPNKLPILSKIPKIPSLLKPSAPPHQTSPKLSFSKPGTPTPQPKNSLSLRPGKPWPPRPQSLSTLASTVGPSSTMTTSILGEPLPTPFTPTLPSLLPTGRVWHQYDLLPGLQGIRPVLGPSVPGAPTMGQPNSSRPTPESSHPNLPILLPLSTLSEAVRLFFLPQPFESMVESKVVESKVVESLNSPAFYTFLTPDEDGNPHWDGNSEEILRGVGGSMGSQANFVGLGKCMLPSIFTFSSSGMGNHFVIHIPHSEDKVFTLDGCPGDLLQLIEDPKAGLHVGGQLLGAPPRPSHEDQTHTYFQIITVTADKPQAYVVTITCEGTLLLSWGQPVLLRRPQLQVHMASVAPLKFLVLWHCYRHPSTLQLPHIGFYVNGSDLSPLAHGLLGQLQHTDIQLVIGPTEPCLRRHHSLDVPMAVGKRLLKDSPRLLPHWAACWLVKRPHVERLLGHPYLAYVL